MAVIKFTRYPGATASSRWAPGTLTNQNTKKFQQPRLLIVTDPKSDRQAVIEASFVNILCIAPCYTDNSLEFVDVAIPCNNRTTYSISWSIDFWQEKFEFWEENWEKVWDFLIFEIWLKNSS